METERKAIITPVFRVAFPAVFTPTAMEEWQESKYSIVCLFKKGEDLSKLRVVVDKLITEKWGAKPPKTIKKPFREQGDRDYEGFEAGAIYISARNKKRPGLVDKDLQPITDQNDFYSGCYARASVMPFVFDKTTNKGVAFSLFNIQKVADGERLDGGVSAEKEFDVFGGEVAGAVSSKY